MIEKRTIDRKLRGRRFERASKWFCGRYSPEWEYTRLARYHKHRVRLDSQRWGVRLLPDEGEGFERLKNWLQLVVSGKIQLHYLPPTLPDLLSSPSAINNASKPSIVKCVGPTPIYFTLRASPEGQHQMRLHRCHYCFSHHVAQLRPLYQTLFHILYMMIFRPMHGFTNPLALQHPLRSPSFVCDQCGFWIMRTSSTCLNLLPPFSASSIRIISKIYKSAYKHQPGFDILPRRNSLILQYLLHHRLRLTWMQVITCPCRLWMFALCYSWKGCLFISERMTIPRSVEKVGLVDAV